MQIWVALSGGANECGYKLKGRFRRRGIFSDRPGKARIFAAMQNVNPLRIRAISDLLIVVGLAALGGVLFSYLGTVLAAAVCGIPVSDIPFLMNSYASTPGARTALLILQSCLALGSFMLFPGLMLFFRRPNEFETPAIPIKRSVLGLVILLAVLMMPVNAWLSLWNESIHFPSFLKELEQMAIQKEDELRDLTLFLVDFQSISEMVLGFIVISFIAGLTEEFFFRKLLQPRLIAIFGNFHAGIWITAFIFSAIHVQFFGLIPRMVLGALFGYYYFWTGRIWVPVFAHTLNNFITLAAMVLYTRKISPVDIENTQILPWFISATAAGFCLTLALKLRDNAKAIRSEISAYSPEKEYDKS